MELTKKNRDDLNRIVSTLLGKTVSAYFDSFVYLSAYSPDINKCNLKINIFFPILNWLLQLRHQQKSARNPIHTRRWGCFYV